MHEHLTDEIWKELGPVDPDWFQLLTTQASSREENISDQEELCPNQEGNIKKLEETSASRVESQQFSTPKVFRRRNFVSPDAEDQQQGKETSPWGARSPCLFQSFKDASNYGLVQSHNPDCFGLLNTPLKSPASYAQRISESLGANLNPDISWTSSLNTPSALPSTIILSDREESPRPGTFALSGTVLMVRKLFPSLSNANQNEAENNDSFPVALQADSPEAGPRPESRGSPQNTQELPDAINGDRGIHSPLSESFADMNSELKMVKSSEQGQSAQEQDINHPVEVEASQWSPLSFTDIPATSISPLMDNKCKTQTEGDRTPGQTVKPAFKSTGFTKKKAKFIYTIDKKKHSLNNFTQGHDVELFQTSDEKSRRFHEGDRKKELQEREIVTEEKLPPLLQPNTQDLDMSQLCRVFAKDFSQMTHQGEPPKVAPQPHTFSPSACLTALKVVRQKNPNLVRVELEAPPQETIVEVMAFDSGFLSAVTDVSHLTATHSEKPSTSHCWTLQTTSTEQNEAEVSVETPAKDTLTQRASSPEVLTRHLVSVPSRIRVKIGKTVSAFKTASDKAIKISASNLQKAERLFDETSHQEPVKVVFDEEIPTTSSAGSCPVTVSKKFLSQEVDENSRGTEETLEGFSSSVQKAENAPKNQVDMNTTAYKDDQSTRSDGAPNKEILSSFVSSYPIKLPLTKESLQGASLSVTMVKNAPEMSGNVNTVACRGDQPENCNHEEEIAPTSTLDPLEQNRDNCQLTASQKADVKELCSLLEEAESQFEFTQFTTTKLKPLDQENVAPIEADKELDPGFLSGIDFDDSFSTEANEKANSIAQEKAKLQVPDVIREPPTAHPIQKENTITKGLQTGDKSVSKKCLKKIKHLFQDFQENIQSHLSTVSQKNVFIDSYNAEPLSTFANVGPSSSTLSNSVSITSHSSSSSGFFTAAGKHLSVSAEAISKAKHLFDEDEQLKPGSLSQIKHVDHCPSGFQTAGGKQVAISSAALKKAKSLLDDCIEIKEPQVGFSSRNSENQLVDVKPGIADFPFDNFGSGVKTSFAKQGISAHVSNPSLGGVSSFMSGGGFSTASGKEVCISEAAIEKNQQILREDPEDPFTEMKHGSFSDVDQHPGGFQTAGGNLVAVSSSALQKAKFLLDDCDPSEFPSDTGKPVLTKTAIAKNTDGKNTNAAPTLESKNVWRCKNEDNFKKPPSLDVGGSSWSGGGFSTASGKKVSVSAAALVKARHLLQKDQEDAPSTNMKSVNWAGGFETPGGKQVAGPSSTKVENHSNPSLDVIGSSLSGGGFSTASGKKVSVSAAALVKARHLLQKDQEDASSTNMKSGNFSGAEGVNSWAGGFETPGGKQVAGPSSTKVENHSNPSLDVFSSSLSGGGFSTASGKKVSVSATAMVKARQLLQEVQENDSSTNMKHGSFSGRVDNWAGGFQTAGGQQVAVSSAALKKAKSLFDDCGPLEKNPASKSSYSPSSSFLSGKENPGAFSGKRYDVKQVNDGHKETLDYCFSNAFAQNDHFKDVNTVGMSEKDQERSQTKANLPDVKFGNVKAAQFMDVESIGQSNNLTNIAKPTSEIFLSSLCGGGFCTASGKNVSVSEEALTKANSFFNDDCDKNNKSLQDDKKHSLQNVGLTSTSEARKKAKSFFMESQEAMADAPQTSTPISGSFSLASGKKILVSDNRMSPLDESLARDKKPATAETNAREGQKILQKFDSEISKTTEEPSVVNFQSLDLINCTETQQLFLAQEALDCTKALLQDESVAGESMTLGNVLAQNDSNGTPEKETCGKRLAEDADLNDQPPLKRRLLEEFDRSLDTPGRSKLCPQRSFHNGLAKDRPAFNYNLSLGPHVTTPHRDGLGYIEGAASPKRTLQASPTGLTSIPPFFKKTEGRPRNCNTKTRPAFVPPFKRENITIEQSSTKPYNSNTTSEASCTTALDHLFSDQSPPAVSTWSQGTALEKIVLAQNIQDMRIRKKKRQTIKPLPGSLFRTKSLGETRISLKDLVHGRTPGRYTQKQLYEYGVHHHVCKITSENAEAFRFHLEMFFNKEALADESGVQLADGGHLVASKDGMAGKEQFFKALCDVPGVDPKLLSDVWVYNHYRWIVWKLASMERSFPETLGGLCLTPERVLLQLKYRYDLEVDHSRRPALRKIVEKDDTATKTLVLCVCGVVSKGQSENLCAVVWVTDGWYAVKAQLDEPLSARLRRGRLAVGGKIIVHGAQLVGSQDGCAPLEAPESLMLKIFANGTRPARWDTKLGFYKDPRPFTLPLSSLYGNGGHVGCADILVLRSYPVQWMERKSEGGVVFRSTRAEEKEAVRYNGQKQKAMEVLYAKIQAELEQEDDENKPQVRRRTLNHRDIAGLKDGQELHEAVGDDMAGLEAQLSEKQLETLQAYRRCLMDKKQAEMQDRYRRATEKNTEDDRASCLLRDVTPVWRLCIADSLNPAGNIYQFNIWRPSPDLQALLKEGRRYKVYNLATSERKKRGSVATLQLTATKSTQFQDLQTSSELLSACFQPRVSTDFVALQNMDFDPLCGEVDLTGCVVRLMDGQGPSPAFYLVDCNMNFLKVRCFNSLLQAGLVEVVKPNVMLALSNIQLRGQSTQPTPVVYAGDLATFSTNPKEEHLQQGLDRLRNRLRDQDNFFQCAEEKLSELLKSDVWSLDSAPSLPPKTPTTPQERTTVPSCAVTDASLPRNTPQQAVRSLRCFTPVSRNLQSKPSSLEKDPRSLKRRKAVDYLSCIPSPPSLLHPTVPSASPSVRKTFNPPRRIATPQTLTPVDTPTRVSVGPPQEKEEGFVRDQELAMIDTQALLL
ncbi:breast cancer type 2 susceptibility protein [Stigmatopora argus]